MIINHNISALNTHRQLGANNSAVQGSLEKLSSGLKINRAGDDAAGLAISEKMRAQIKGLDMATKNAQDGISLIQTAEGALTETHSILQRMRELAVQSSSDTNENDVDRKAMQKELADLTAEINAITDRTEFNTQTLLDGDFKNKTFHIGANQGQNITVSIDAMTAESIGLNKEIEIEADKYVQGTENVTVAGPNTASGTSTTLDVNANVVYEVDADGVVGSTVVGIEVDGEFYAQADITATAGGTLSVATGTTATADLTETVTQTFNGVDISNRANADASIKLINDAINVVSTQRSNLGAIQNRLEHTINNLGASSEKPNCGRITYS